MNEEIRPAAGRGSTTLRIRVADTNFLIEGCGSMLRHFCRDYTADFDRPDCVIRLTDEDIERERAISERQTKPVNPLELEIAAAHRQLADAVLRRGIMLMHGAAVAVDGRCYIFTAPSGTGKTTHIRHWLSAVPGSYVLNGDKPLIGVSRLLVYGTPWSGKERMNANTAVPLAGLIQLARGTENVLTPRSFSQMLPCLVQQCYIPADREGAQIACGLMGGLQSVPCWLLRCTPDETSARVAYEGLTAAR